MKRFAMLACLALTSVVDATAAPIGPLAPGDRVRLQIPSAGQAPVLGRLVGRAGDTLTLAVEPSGTEVRVPARLIAGLEKQAGVTHRAAEGVRVGAVLGVVTGALATSNREHTPVGVILACGAGGAVAGLAIGHAQRSPAWITLAPLEWDPDALASRTVPLPRAGVRARVRTLGARSAEVGTVVESRDDTLWFDPEWERRIRVLGVDDLERIEVSVGRGNYAMAGFVGGMAGGVGLALFIAGLGGDEVDFGETMLLSAYFGIPAGLLGAFVGGVMSYERWQTVYIAPATSALPAQTQVRLALVPMRGGAGLAVTMRR